MISRLWVLLDGVLIGIVWAEYVDLTLRVLSGIAALIVTWYVVQSYKSKSKLDEVNLKIAKEKLRDMLDKNKQGNEGNEK